MGIPAESVRRLTPFFRERGVRSVLDYGTGRMRNAVFLAGEGFRVYAADLPEQVERLRGSDALRHVEGLFAVEELSERRLVVDLVLSTYVFNIILTREEREAYAATAARSLGEGGYLLVEVRCRRDEECGAACPARRGAECVKALSLKELDGYFLRPGFARIDDYARDHALVAIYRKGDRVRPSRRAA